MLFARSLTMQEARVEERRAEANVGKVVVRAPVDGLVVVSQTFCGLEFSQIQAGDQLRPSRKCARALLARAEGRMAQEK